METDWIEAVMRTNAAIVEAEARFSAQAASLIALALSGQDTTEAEDLLLSCRKTLVLLRALQAQLLRMPGPDA
ncbi:hypothetical protein [Methylobacterium flocculans]|jgi:hypothetical protein|uniref:hypothetical protein n=1 Tax=Methylobacterium flocculans TaxID=2984843 RepID=UPI0021F34C4B|nr:hypothetical protein [Methylobacterium sp. FF17]